MREPNSSAPQQSATTPEAALFRPRGPTALDFRKQGRNSLGGKLSYAKTGSGVKPVGRGHQTRFLYKRQTFTLGIIP